VSITLEVSPAEIAAVGHSASQAPQLVQSSELIILGMVRCSLTWLTGYSSLATGRTIRLVGHHQTGMSPMLDRTISLPVTGLFGAVRKGLVESMMFWAAAAAELLNKGFLR